MGKRHSKRFNVFFNAVLISSGDVSYAGFIGNFSGTGMYMIVPSANPKINFTPGTIFNLKLKLPSEETLNLHCSLVWAYEIPLSNPVGKSAYNMGVEIIDPAQKYKEFHRNFVMKNLKDQQFTAKK